MIGTPRIQGKVGEIETPIEDKGKFAFTIWVSVIGLDDKPPMEIGPFGPFDTEQKAKNALREECKNVCKVVEEAITNKPAGNKYIDLKNDFAVRDWDTH